MGMFDRPLKLAGLLLLSALVGMANAQELPLGDPAQAGFDVRRLARISHFVERELHAGAQSQSSHGMSDQANYLYDNKQSEADKRLWGLEAIEDEHSISMLAGLTSLQGCICLEIGAGAGSIAEWLASQVGPSGAVTATDIEPKHLSGSGFEVIRHNIEKEELPTNHYDLVHIRHVLIHIADPLKALEKVFSSMKPGAAILVEESDLSTWEAEESTSAEIRDVFRLGVAATQNVYESRGIDIQIGAKVASLLLGIGFSIIRGTEQKRSVSGGSPEAKYQSLSANQLAASLGLDAEDAAPISSLADCLLNPELQYQSRTTISVSAGRPRLGNSPS